MAKEFPTFHCELEIRTLQLLDSLPRSIDLKDVALATGLSTSWLTSFASRKLKHPSASRLETLYNHLSPIPLFPK